MLTRQARLVDRGDPAAAFAFGGEQVDAADRELRELSETGRKYF